MKTDEGAEGRSAFYALGALGRTFLGAISVVSALLPSVNHAMTIVPLIPTMENLQVAMGTLSAMFAFLLVGVVRAHKTARSPLLAVLLLVMAFAAIGAYVFLHGQMTEYDPRVNVAMLWLYSVVPGLITGAFAVLAVYEYFRVNTLKGEPK